MNLTNYLKQLNDWHHTEYGENAKCTEIIKYIEANFNISFNPESIETDNTCFADSPEIRDDYKWNFTRADLLDYFYALIHSSVYKESHKNSSKIDFTKVPYPKELQSFWTLVEKGRKLKQLHVFQSPELQRLTTDYPFYAGDAPTNPIDNIMWELYNVRENRARIWINDRQYFDDIPLVLWEMYIDGHQPAQSWLRDRQGLSLNSDDILAYQMIIVVLKETERLKKKIDNMINA